MNTNATANLLSPSERDRIMLALMQLCAEQGFGETTVADVVSRAGVEEEDFDELFGGLEECAVGAMNVIVSEVVAVVSTTYEADRSEFESGLHGMKAILELMAAKPSYAHFAYISARQMGPPRLCETRRGGVQVLSAMLERLWEYADLPTQPAGIGVAMVGSAEALVRRELFAGRTDQLPRLLPDIIYMATVPFLGQEEALLMRRRAEELLEGTAWG